MKSTEKASVLVEMYQDYLLEDSYKPFKCAKQCALIAVDQVINTLQSDEIVSLNLGYEETLIEFWQEVKQEIEKL